MGFMLGLRYAQDDQARCCHEMRDCESTMPSVFPALWWFAWMYSLHGTTHAYRLIQHECFVCVTQEKFDEAKLVLERAVPMLVEVHGEQDERTTTVSDSLDALLEIIRSAQSLSQAH